MSGNSSAASAEDVIGLAVQLHRDGHLAEAATLYEQLISRDSSDVNANHFLGVLRHQEGDSKEAVRLIRTALRGDPRYLDARLNLGNVLKETERFEEAAEEYQKLIREAPSNADAHNNLGVAYRALRRLDEAVECFEKAVELDPNAADYFHNLGNAYKASDRVEDCLTAYRKSVELNPRHDSSYLSLGRALDLYGRNDESISVYRQWLKVDPDNPVAQHMLVASEGVDVPDRCSNDYVKTTFDSFATSFDEVLERLDYCAPRLIADVVKRLYPAEGAGLSLLDAGCGTGLCGELLRPFAETMVGADLSSGMLIKAKAKEVYDELAEAELVHFMDQHEGAYDLIVSADTLVYFGVLDQAFQAAARSLRSSGRLVITLERCEEDEAPEGYCLNTSGRYSHTESYLRDCAARCGLRMDEIGREVLRMESKNPVDGHVMVASKID